MAGLATDQEVRELMAAIAQYPEIKAAADAVRLDMERYIIMQSVPPPPTVKDRIFQIVNNEGVDTVVPVTGSTSASLMDEAYAHEEEPAKVISAARKWQWVAAAAVAGLITSIAFNVTYLNTSKEWKGKYEALLVDQTKVLAQNEVYQTQLKESDNMLAMMRSPEVKAVRMFTASKDRPNLLATVFWNPKTKDVILTVNNLPEPAADQQYQLWAIVNGVPVDAGVFEMGDTAKGFQKMKAIEGAQMFAVTLEKKGGSPTPTLTAMYLAGKVSS
ncbi:hypothetical protein GFS24_12765 [Chitinophaga sp. SYP-B3965]|uniref:anti-sigma factor n=1 Tax=Chitinophaga sp. SYP-B3965 TaxID=2663120 RepID=UPI001299A6B5|nr:hypothetical protein [Chitinophaga sp. SYP-B3965]